MIGVFQILIFLSWNSWRIIICELLLLKLLVPGDAMCKQFFVIVACGELPYLLG